MTQTVSEISGFGHSSCIKIGYLNREVTVSKVLIYLGKNDNKFPLHRNHHHNIVTTIIN